MITVVARLIGLRHQHLDTLAFHLGRAPAENAFGGAVDRGNDAMFVDGHDGIEDIVRNGLDAAQRVDGLLLHVQ